MPCTIHWEGTDGVRREFFGELTAAEVRTSLAALTGDPRWDGLRQSIADYLAVRSYRITGLELEELAAIHFGAALTNHRVVSAVVTDSAEIRAIFDRFRALQLSPFPLHIFDNLAAARAWIAQARHDLAPRSARG